MAHRLVPPKGRQCWAPHEAIARLRDEFAFVDVDRDAGANHVGAMLAKLIELAAPQEIVDRYAAAQERAAWVLVADEAASERFLTFVLLPNEGAFVQYESAQHEALVAPLLARCARALSYEVVLV
jgi:hypothetical protein